MSIMADEASPSLTGSRDRFLSWLKPSPPRRLSGQLASVDSTRTPSGLTSASSTDNHRKQLKLSPSKPPIATSNASVSGQSPSAVASTATTAVNDQTSPPHNCIQPSDSPHPARSLPMEAHQIGIAISAPAKASRTSLASSQASQASKASQAARVAQATPGPGDVVRDSRRDSRLFHTASFHLPAQFQSRPSLISRHSRSHSLDAHGGTSQPSSRRPQSSQSSSNTNTIGNITTTGKRPPANLAARRRTIQPLGISAPPSSSDETADMQRVTETTWKSSHPAQPLSLPLPRADSDTTLFTPVRRRSIIRTPGVATRAEPPAKEPPTRTSSIRSSHELGIPAQRRPHTARRLSPPVEHPSPSPQRAVTPCESEYKQLGGMKFGSLRITNGAPRPSPAPTIDSTIDSEMEVEVNQPPSSSSSSSSSGSGQRSPLGHNATPIVSLEDTEAKKPIILFHRPSLRATNTAPNDLQMSTRPSLRGSQPNSDALKYPVVEVLDIRDDPNAKPSAEKIRRDLECKSLKTLHRSDSGFVSSPSSDGSQKTVSKVDSGYGSSASLRSLRSFKTAMTSRSSAEKLVPEKTSTSTLSDAKDNGVVPDRPMSRPIQPKPSFSRTKTPPTQTQTQTQAKTQTKTQMQPQPQSISQSQSQSQAKPTLQAKPQPEKKMTTNQRTLSFTSLARSTGFHMPSLRHSKSREMRPSRPRSSSTPNTENAHRDLSPRDTTPPPPLPTASEALSNTSPGRLERLLSSRRKGPPKVRGSMKTDKRAGLHPALRKETSKETLMTIMSVGSTELLHNDRVRQNGEAQRDGTQPKLLSQLRGSRRLSLRNAKESIAQAATTMLSSGKSTDNSRKPQVLEIPKDRDELPPVPKRASPQKSSSGSSSSSSLRQSSASVPTRIQPSPTLSPPKKPQSKPYPRERAGSSAQLRLDMLDRQAPVRNPSVHDFDQLRKAKTPPPVSMRTRSAQNLRAQATQSANHAHRSAVRRPSLPRVNGGLVTQSYTPATSTGQMYSAVSSSGRSLPASPSRSMSLRDVQAWQGNYGQDLRSYQQRTGHHRRESEPSRRSTRTPSTSQPRHMQTPSHPHPQQAYGTSYMAHPGVIMSHAEQQMILQQASQQMHASIMSMQPIPRQYHQYNAHSTRDPQGHRRASSAQGFQHGQPVPYRVLHSYDSPAYRGVPIWG